jgi:hypothetical protein
MRGRKPKPTRIKALTGNPGKRPLNPHEPRPAPALLTVRPNSVRWHARSGRGFAFRDDYEQGGAADPES